MGVSKKAGSVVAVVLVWVGTSLGPATHSRHHLAECSISPVSSSCYRTLDTPLMGMGLTKHLYTTRADCRMQAQGARLHIIATVFRICRCQGLCYHLVLRLGPAAGRLQARLPGRDHRPRQLRLPPLRHPHLHAGEIYFTI